MRRFLPLLAVLLLPLHALGQDLPPSVSFKTEKATYKVGEEIKGTVTATFEPGLHGYQNPPSKDFMLAVTVKPGDGTVVKSVAYPKGHIEMAGGEEAAVYSGTVSFPVVISAPTVKGKVKLNLGFYYQQCDANTCYMPNTIPVIAEVTIEASSDAAPGTPSGAKVAPRIARFSLVAPTVPVQAGAEYTAQLRVSPGPGLMLVQPQHFTAPVRVIAEGLSVIDGRVGRKTTIGGQAAIVHGGSFDLPMHFRAPTNAGTSKVTIEIDYVQANSAEVFKPQLASISFTLDVVDEQAGTVSPPSTQPEQPQSEPQDTSNTSSSDNDGLLGFLNKALEEGNWALIIPAALLTGLALCLTPCVFPMIPITITFFSNQGSKTTTGRFSLGLFYALGIAVTYGAAGGIAAASGGAVGELFTKAWFLLALGALMIVLALSMFDVYELRLPGFIQKNLKGRSGPVGALIMGLLMGFAAAPCAGALVLAVAVKVANIGSIPVGLGMFGLIGIGMGLPFMVLATASSSAKALPKSGGWLKTTKAVLGLVVLYIAFDYLFKGIGFSPSEARTQIAWIFVFIGFAAYLLFIDNSDPSRAVARIKGVTAVALGIAGGLAYSTYSQIKFDEEYARLVAAKGIADQDSQVVGKTINWIPYNDENFAKAVASGKPIMIDGRADWCTICHEMEARVFHTPEGLVALSSVYLLEVDWSTNVDPVYIEMTKKRFSIKGLPHVVFMQPGGKNEFFVGNIEDVAELKGYLQRVGAKP